MIYRVEVAHFQFQKLCKQHLGSYFSRNYSSCLKCTVNRVATYTGNRGKWSFSSQGTRMYSLTLSYYNLILFYILHSIQSGLVILVPPIRASPHKNLLKHPIFLHHLSSNHFSGVCLLPPITTSA